MQPLKSDLLNRLKGSLFNRLVHFFFFKIRVWYVFKGFGSLVFTIRGDIWLYNISESNINHSV